MFEKTHLYIYRQKPESALCENQKRYLVGFVICLILLILSVAVNVVQFCISSRKQSRQGKIFEAGYKVCVHAQKEALPFSQLKFN